MLELAITQGADFLRYTRNAKAIDLPDGTTVLGPLAALPHVAGDYAIRAVVVDGPEAGPLEIGGTEAPVVEGDAVVVRRTVQAMAADMARAVLLVHLASRRWQTETGGTVWNDWELPTDERSQQKYAAEALAVQIGNRIDPSPWKLPHGFALLTNAQVTEMASTARAHVLACFALEAALAAQIDAGTVASIAEIDAAFTAAFPQD